MRSIAAIDVVEVEHLGSSDLLAAEGEQLPRQLGGALRRLDDLLELVAHCGAARPVLSRASP